MKTDHFILGKNYEVLELLYRNHRIESGKNVVAMSKLDIAEKLGYDRMTIHKIICELIKREYLYPVRNTNKKYIITEKGIRLVRAIEKI